MQGEQPYKKICINYTNFIHSLQGPYDQHYELSSNILLGRGGFGKVFQVRYKTNNELRAMKIIPKKNQDIHREFELLKELDHPNILKLYHSFEDEQNYYIVSELCEGGNLFDYILGSDEDMYKKMIYSFHERQEKQIAKIMKQLVSAVKMAHFRRIVHRDIKPENILLESSGNQIKLIDWGFMSSLDESKLQQKCGSLLYGQFIQKYFCFILVAPEVIKGNYDEKCDIWSCGVVLYVLLCRDPPFQGKDSQEVLNSIFNAKLDFRADFWKKRTEDVKDLLQKMLQVDPNVRLTAEQVLEHRWFDQSNEVKNKFIYYRQESQIPSQVFNESLFQLDNYAQLDKIFEKRFMQSIILFISAHLVHKKDKSTLHKIFQKIDKNADGTISKEELEEAFQQIYPSCDQSILKHRIERIFDLLDLNSSGSLDYSEFIAATCRLDGSELELQIQTVFDFFDQNNDGDITIDEIAQIMGKQHNWNEIFTQFDIDLNNRISANEFKTAILQYIEYSKQRQL